MKTRVAAEGLTDDGTAVAFEAGAEVGRLIGLVPVLAETPLSDTTPRYGRWAAVLHPKHGRLRFDARALVGAEGVPLPATPPPAWGEAAPAAKGERDGRHMGE